MTISLDQLATSIIKFLRTELRVDEEITLDLPLFTAGLIDSAGLVRMAALVERETGLTIPDRDVNIDHFDTIRGIQEYVAARIR